MTSERLNELLPITCERYPSATECPACGGNHYAELLARIEAKRNNCRVCGKPKTQDSGGSWACRRICSGASSEELRAHAQDREDWREYQDQNERIRRRDVTGFRPFISLIRNHFGGGE